MTIAQRLNIKDFPFVVRDSGGRIIYYENSHHFWEINEYEQSGKQIYYENSEGLIEDYRPKPEANILGHWHKGGDESPQEEPKVKLTQSEFKNAFFGKAKSKGGDK